MQQVYQQQMETQASQAIKDAASNQGNNCSDTMTIELDVSKNSQYEDISQIQYGDIKENCLNRTTNNNVVYTFDQATTSQPFSAMEC